MGQRALGILYGVESPKKWADEEDGEWHVIGRWGKTLKKAPRYGKDLQVRIETQGDKRLVGVWVAVGGSGEDGAPYLGEKCVPLDEIESVHEAAIAKASKLWVRFHSHVAKTEGIDLPPPRLWLTPCEVA